MVLCSGLGTVAALFFVCRLLPGRKAKLIVHGVTDDRFALVVEHEDAERDLDEMRQVFEPTQPLLMEERVLDKESCGCDCACGHSGHGKSLFLPINILLAGVLVLMVAFAALVPQKPNDRNWELFSEMVHSPAATALSANEALGGITLQSPVPGAIARGMLPLHVDEPGDDIRMPGSELVNPNQPGENGMLPLGVLERGKTVFGTHCACCHGGTGDADGTIIARGHPAPAALAVGKSAPREKTETEDAYDGWTDGQFFHAISYGRGNADKELTMPPHEALISRADRWKLVCFVRDLQEKAIAKVAAAEATAAQKEESNAADANAEDAADADVDEDGNTDEAGEVKS